MNIIGYRHQMSKTPAVMSADDAKDILSEFKCVSPETSEYVMSSPKYNISIFDMITDVIIKYYGPNGEHKISFHTSAKTMVLLLLQSIYYSSSSNGYTLESNLNVLHQGHNIGTIEYNLWKWISGHKTEWEETMNLDIPPSLIALSRLHIDNENMNEECCKFSHTVFLMIINVMGAKISRLYRDTHKFGASGVIIKSHELNGLWTDMNPNAANPELFNQLENAALAYVIVKKEWEELIKKIKKEKKEEAKALKLAAKKK